MIKLIVISIILLYGSFILLGFVIYITSYSKFNIKFFFYFFIKLITNFFIFFVDFFFFIRNFLIWIVIYIYNIYHDIITGWLLGLYTDTDLNAYKDEDDDEDDEAPKPKYVSETRFISFGVGPKDFDLIHFEAIYFYLRILQIFKFSYLLLNLCYFQIYWFCKVIFSKFLQNNIFLWLIYYLILNFFYIIRFISLKFIIKAFWEFILRVRTYIFIIIHQEYFFIWIYKFFNGNWAFDLEMRGNTPFDEQEPSELFYNFFSYFYNFRFINKKDKFFKFNLKNSFFLFIIFFILFNILNLIIFYLKKYLNNIFLLKIEYYLKSYFYLFLLKFEYFDFFSVKYILKFFLNRIQYILKKFNILNLIVFIILIFKFFFNKILIYILKFFGIILNYVLIFVNVILLNTIIIFIKGFPLFFNLILYLRGFIVIILIIYYIDFEYLILLFHYCLDALYDFYSIKIFPKKYYIRYNRVYNFPVTNEFGVIPYEFWDEFPTLSATPLNFHNTLRRIPRYLLPKKLRYYNKFALDMRIYISIRWVEARYGYWFIVRDYWLKLKMHLWENLWNLKMWRYQLFHFLSLYKKLFIIRHKIIISYKYVYIWHKFDLFRKYVFTYIGINCLYIPYFWYYRFLKKIFPSILLNNIEFVRSQLWYFIKYLYNCSHSYLIYLIFISYDFLIFSSKLIYKILIKTFFNIELTIINSMSWLKNKSKFLNLLWNSFFFQSLNWYRYIIFFDCFNVDIYQHYLEFFIDWIKNNNFYNLNLALYFELINNLHSLYIKYKFIKNGPILKTHFLLRNVQYSFEIFCYFFYIIWEYIDQIIDSLSFNYDQFRIFYHDRIDVDEALIIGEVSKKTKIEAGIRKRWVTNKMRKTGVSNTGTLESMFLSSFAFVLVNMFAIRFESLDLFISRGIIYAEYAQHYGLIIAFEYYVIILIICSFLWYLFPSWSKFLSQKNVSLNSEYCWRQFRKSSGSEIVWLFTSINKYVKNYFLNKKYEKGAPFRKQFDEDIDFINYMEEVNFSKFNKTSLNTGSQFETIAENPYLWRSYWIHEFIDQFRIHELKNVTNPKFNFSMFYFDPEYHSYYNNYIYNNVFFQALLLYGTQRNKHLSVASLNEGLFELIPQFHNKTFKKRSECSNMIKEYFFKLDEQVYYGLLPWWCLHKDLFSYQLIDTKIVYKNEFEFLNNSNSYEIEEDQKYFLVESPSMWLSNFIAYWLFLFPLYLCYKYLLVWPRHYIIIKQEINLYLYGFLGRLSVLNSIFNILPSPYWADILGERKKAGSHGAERIKYKRRYRDRVKYILDVTGWGPLCSWKARLNKKYYFLNGFYIIYMYIKYIFLYFFIVILFFSLYSFFFIRTLYKFKNYRIWQYKFYKNFWKLKLYINKKNFIKFNFFKKW